MIAPLVSVVIPTFNRAEVVGEAIESVLDQTYSPIEVIVVDDGSTDDTLDKLRKYGNRIRVICQPNSGPSVARNAGVRESRGEILAFLDSDDLWLPRKLEKQVAVLNQIGKSVVCCLSNMTLHFADGRTTTSFAHSRIDLPEPEGIWLNVPPILLTRFVMFIQAVAIRRDAFDAVRGFDARFWCMEDFDLAIRLSLLGPWAVLREPLATWQQSEGGLSQKSTSLSQRQALVQICETLLAGSTLVDPNIRKQVQQVGNRAKRDLKALQRTQSAGRLSKWAGEFELRFRRIADIAYPRWFTYPEVEVCPVADYQAGKTPACTATGGPSPTHLKCNQTDSN